jgi:hypothetical protein
MLYVKLCFSCRSGDHDFIGEGVVTLREITPGRGGTVVNLELVNPEIKKKKKKYVNSGVLHFSSVKATQLHTFTDYIRGGCEINLMVAIDFTVSVPSVMTVAITTAFDFLFCSFFLC